MKNGAKICLHLEEPAKKVYKRTNILLAIQNNSMIDDSPELEVREKIREPSYQYAGQVLVQGNIEYRHGMGIFYDTTTHVIYEGQFRFGKFHGYGRKIEANSKVSEGFWVKDKLKFPKK